MCDAAAHRRRINEEEQDELFPKCRKTSMDLDEIGRQLSDRKDALMAVAA